MLCPRCGLELTEPHGSDRACVAALRGALERLRAALETLQRALAGNFDY